MERSDLLLTTAQIGMALAGFAGLVTLLGRPVPARDARLNAIRFRSMVVALCVGVGVALELNAAGAFRAPAGVYFVSLFANFLGAAFFFIRLLYAALPEADA